MNSLIIYGSKYGATKRYAEKFAEMTHLPLINFENVKTLAKYEQIIYFGALYASGIKGLKRSIKKMPSNVRLIIVTVGLSDPNNKENINKINSYIKKQVPEQFLKNSTTFHLRGGIDYSKLGFMHKVMMKTVYNSIKNKAINSLTQEDKEFINTYNKKVDFVDFNSLKQILEAIK